LRSFARKTIAKGGSATVSVSIPVSKLAKWDNKAGKPVVPKGKYIIFAGGSSAEEAAVAAFEVK
jgi:hypothetical protein